MLLVHGPYFHLVITGNFGLNGRDLNVCLLEHDLEGNQDLGWKTL